MKVVIIEFGRRSRSFDHESVPFVRMCWGGGRTEVEILFHGAFLCFLELTLWPYGTPEGKHAHTHTLLHLPSHLVTHTLKTWHQTK